LAAPTESKMDHFVKETLLSLAERTPDTEDMLQRLKLVMATKFMTTEIERLVQLNPKVTC
jgi:hypothetical protein